MNILLANYCVVVLVSPFKLFFVIVIYLIFFKLIHFFQQ